MDRREFLKCGAMAGAVTVFSPAAFAVALEEGNRRKTLILGGSAFALGYALAHPGEAVILERGILLAPEFAATKDYAELGIATSPLGRELVAGLEESGILKDGKIELPPLADFMSEFFAAHGGYWLLWKRQSSSPISRRAKKKSRSIKTFVWNIIT